MKKQSSLLLILMLLLVLAGCGAKPAPTEPQPSFRQRVNSVVSGFYESLDNTFKNFTLTAESGLEQLKTEPIGGGTAKGE